MMKNIKLMGLALLLSGALPAISCMASSAEPVAPAAVMIKCVICFEDKDKAFFPMFACGHRNCCFPCLLAPMMQPLCPSCRTPFDLNATVAANLSRAALDGNEYAVGELLNTSGLELEEPDLFGMTAVHSAIINDHVEVLRKLIDAGADTSAADHRGMTPLMDAVGVGSLACVKLILGTVKGRDSVNVSDKDHSTALKYALDFHGADPDCYDQIITELYAHGAHGAV